MKSQMKAADRSGAQVAVIIGSDELAAGTAVVRPLRTAPHDTKPAHEQHVVPRTDLLESVQKVLA
jgi:histidyl-tRNA synthetase